MSSIHSKPSGAFVVKFRHLGRQRSLTFKTEKDAKKWKAYLDTHGADKALELFKVATKSLDLLTHATAYIEHLTGVTAGTKKTYQRYVKNHFTEIGQVELTAITPNTVSAWLNELVAKGLSGKSIANIHAFLSGALETAVRDEIIPKNPSKGLRLPKTHSAKQEMVFLTYSEFDELAELIDPFYRNFITVLVGTGMRFGEATALTVADVDFKTRSIRINKAWKMTGTSQRELGVPKTERSNRTVAMPPQVVEAIAPQVAGKKRTQLVFTNKQGNQLAHNVFHPVWQEAVKPFEEKTGIHPRIHDLRHTFASWCIQDNISLPVIQRSLGHESIQTTINIYGHLARSDFDALASSIGMAWGNSLKAIEN